METYVLIMTLLYPGVSATVATAEFADKLACKAAGEAWKNSIDSSRSLNAMGRGLKFTTCKRKESVIKHER